MTNPNQERSREENLSPRIWSRDPRSLSIRGNKIPRRATKFILSCWIFARASNHFSREKEGRGGGGRGGGSVCKSCQTLQRRTEQRQRVHPISRLGRKNFHYSLIPSSPHLPPPPPSLPILSLLLSPPRPRYSTPLHLAAPWKTDTSRRKSESYFPRCSFPESLFFLPFSPLPPSRITGEYQNCRKGEEGSLLTAFAAVGSRVATDGRLVSWESCFRNAARIVSHLLVDGRRRVEETETRGWCHVNHLLPPRPPPITSGIGLVDRMCVAASAETNGRIRIWLKILWSLGKNYFLFLSRLLYIISSYLFGVLCTRYVYRDGEIRFNKAYSKRTWLRWGWIIFYYMYIHSCVMMSIVKRIKKLSWDYVTCVWIKIVENFNIEYVLFRINFEN